MKPGSAVELVRRLREEVVSEALEESGLAGLNYGFRQQDSDTFGLAVSVWVNYDDLLRSTSGNTERIGSSVSLADLVDEVGVAHYEVAESSGAPDVVLEGAVIGVIVSTLKPHVEPTAFELIRASAAAIYEAGAVARHIGRRVAGNRSEVAAVVVWRDRQALRHYARNQPEGFMRPAYVDLLEDWTFETYDALSPDRLLISSAGPAVLLADDEGRYVDASPGVERVFGLPGEFMLGRYVYDFTPGAVVDAARVMWQEFVAAGEMDGEYELQRPSGGRVMVRYRAKANCPEPGVHASVLWLPGDLPDDRPVEEITRDAYDG